MWHGTIAVLLLAIQLSTTCLIVGFAPRRSIFRLASLPLTIFYTYLQFTNLPEVHHPIGRAFLGGASTFAVILFIDLVLLSQWTFEAKGPTSTLGGVSASLDARHTSKDYQSKCSPAIVQDSTISRLQFGFSVGLQTRFPKSIWKIKNIPPFYRSRPYDTPSRTGFLIWSISKVALYIVFLRAIGGQDPSQNQSIFSQAQVPVFARLGSITSMELTTRLLSTFGFWTALVMVDDMLYSFLAIPAILFRLTGVDAWPPIFGWPQDAYSIRQFWGCSFHQLLRRGCSSIAYFVTFSCFRIAKGGYIARYALLLMTFLVSGVFHALCDISQGIPLSESGAMHFFCIQAIGIIVEDSVQAAFMRSIGTQTRRRVHLFPRLIGHVWLLAWLTWTSPVWIYPAMSRDTGTPIVPF